MEFDSLRIGYSTPGATQQVYDKSSPKSSSDVEEPASQDASPSSSQLDVHIKDRVSAVNEKNREEGASGEKKREKEPSEDDIIKSVTEANKKLRGSFREFSYNVHEKTNTVMIKVIDSKTKETIREIPPEKTLDALAKMWELAGIIVDEKK